MTSRRMIASDIFEDDFIGSLSFFERLVWIGLFAVCADDQGRIIDNPAIIRAKVFPFDQNVDDTKVETAMEQAAKAGKVMRYEVAGRRLLQIIKWWEYQTPSWASPSKYPAPPGWVDRHKYHAAGNEIKSLNWGQPGGLCSPLTSKLSRAIEEGEVKGDGEGEGERREEEPLRVPSNLKNPQTLPIFQAVTGWTAFPASERSDCEDTLAHLQTQFKGDELITYLKKFFKAFRERYPTSGRCFWLTDWAATGQIPQAKNNGSRKGAQSEVEITKMLEEALKDVK